MKISFSNSGSNVLLANRQITWCIVLLICLLSGSYLVGRYLGLLVVLLLSTAGIVIARTVSARLNADKSAEVETAPSWNDTPQITAGWDYRPRRAIRRCAYADSAAETAGGPSSTSSAVNENVWFNALDRSAAEPQSMIEDATGKVPLSDCADVVSLYDQSPIDEQTAVAEDGCGKTEIKFARS